MRVIGLALCLPAAMNVCFANPGDILAKAMDRARQHVKKLPDYVCTQRIERAHRSPRETTFRVQDRLHVEVTMLGGKERFAWADARRFEDKELRDMVSRGLVSTGNFGLYTRHVFQPGSAEIRPAGDAEFEGRRAMRFEYEVPWEKSGFRISVPPHESTVAFRGSFLVDAETHDVLQLEVIADEIPPELGMDRTRNVMKFRMLPVGEAHHPFPVHSEVTVITLDGAEHRNQVKLEGCRQYGAESKLTFAEEAQPAAAAIAEGVQPQQQQAPAEAQAKSIPARSELEVELDAEINLETVAAGEPFRATLAEPLRGGGQQILLPQGTRVAGRVLRVDRLNAPVDRYEVSLQLHSIEPSAGQQVEIVARLQDTGNAGGLIRQQKTFMPAFDKKRANRFNVLVKESNAGQGLLYWDAKAPRIRKGFRMRWRTEEAAQYTVKQ